MGNLCTKCQKKYQPTDTSYPQALYTDTSSPNYLNYHTFPDENRDSYVSHQNQRSSYSTSL